ncbi:MAG TPA: hypothetical protein VNL70_06305, partial [Tepidisphaeraceae bacterium]|nr:hypothetical protein [Tepidisphaeraceae bacterium]
MHSKLATWIIAAAVALQTFASGASAKPLRLDINADNDRRDMLSQTCQNWRVSDGASASQRFGDLLLTLRATRGTIRGDMWKGGIDHNSPLANDGVYVHSDDRAGMLELLISGLSPGPHSITTYHNATWPNADATFDVLVNGKVAIQGLRQSVRVENDEDAATAFVQVQAEAGKDLVLSFRSSNGPVMLSGIEIDHSDPKQRASHPSPADGDLHADCQML